MQNETQATSLRLRLSKNIVFEQPLDRNHASDRKFGFEPRPTGHNSEPSCIKTVIHAPGFYGKDGLNQRAQRYDIINVPALSKQTKF